MRNTIIILSGATLLALAGVAAFNQYRAQVEEEIEAQADIKLGFETVRDDFSKLLVKASRLHVHSDEKEIDKVYRAVLGTGLKLKDSRIDAYRAEASKILSKLSVAVRFDDAQAEEIAEDAESKLSELASRVAELEQR
jgi:hypothetical protein